MVWPPQDTGLFAVPECIACCVVTPACIREFFDNPFLTSLYTLTRRPGEISEGVVVTPTNMGTFTRFSCDIPNFSFGFDRYYINDAFEYDPVACGLSAGQSWQMNSRIVSRTGTIPLNVTFYPMVQQGGNFYLNTLSTRRWSRNAITAGFQTNNVSTLSSDPWDRFNTTDGSPNSSFHPDFTAAGGPIKMGFRAVYASLNTNGATRNLTWDIENFGALL